MTRYIAQRLLAGLLTALLASLLIFLSIRVAPGYEAVYVHRGYYGLPPWGYWDYGYCDADCEKTLEEILEESGYYPPPIRMQYLNWVGGWVTGDWEESIWSEEAGWDSFARRLPVTLQLVVMAQALAALVGVTAGVIMALRRNTRIDHVGRTLCKTGLALPVFWTATLLLIGGFYFLDWSPRIVHNPLLEDPLGNLDQFILPAIALSYVSCAAVALMVRSSALNILLRQDFVPTYPSSGAGHSFVVFLHTLKNILMPVIVALCLTLPVAIGGSVIIEPLFDLEGIGNMLVKAALSDRLPCHGIPGPLLLRMGNRGQHPGGHPLRLADARRTLHPEVAQGGVGPSGKPGTAGVN